MMRLLTPVLACALLAACGPDIPPAGPRDGGTPGSDSSVTCATGTTQCAGTCVSTDTSSLHCGACGNACGAGMECVSGACVCAAGFTMCGTACADTERDEQHCGGCDQPCGAGESCTAGTCDACGVGVSFAADVQPIFTGNCTGPACHTGARPASGLSLEAGRAYAELVGVASSCPDRRPLVTAGDVAASYLADKIAGTNLCGGQRMPLGRGSLGAAQEDLIREWICGGARND